MDKCGWGKRGGEIWGSEAGESKSLEGRGGSEDLGGKQSKTGEWEGGGEGIKYLDECHLGSVEGEL